MFTHVNCNWWCLLCFQQRQCNPKPKILKRRFLHTTRTIFTMSLKELIFRINNIGFDFFIMFNMGKHTIIDVGAGNKDHDAAVNPTNGVHDLLPRTLEMKTDKWTLKSVVVGSSVTMSGNLRKFCYDRFKSMCRQLGQLFNSILILLCNL